MPDIYLDVDTALSGVPVNIFPLTDDTDFKTRETAVAYNAAGMDLVWNFVTSAGAFTQTAVTPTTAGNYDWTHQGDGMYTIEIPASGGASINNDTEGYGWFTGVATGVLPWRGPILGFRHSAINDSLCDTNTTGILAPTTAGRTLDVSATGEAGLDWANIGSPSTTVNLSGTTVKTATDVETDTADIQTRLPADLVGGRIDANMGAISADSVAADNAESFFDGTGYAGTNNVIPTVTTVSAVTTVNGLAAGTITAAAIATGAIDADALAADAVAEIADGVLDEALSGHTTAGTLGKAIADIEVDTSTTLQAELDGIQADTEDIQARLPAALVGGRIDANVGAISSDSVAADNCEAFFDGTGYAGTGNTIPTVTTVNGLAANVITAAATSADFGTEVGTAVWASAARTLTALDEDSTTMDLDATIRSAVGLASANLDTQIADLPTVAEFEARTPTAAQLAYIVANAATGLPVTFTTSGGSTTAAVLNLVDGNAASATNDQYNGRLLVFTDGTLKGVVTDITDYVGATTTATITAIPTAPTSSHNARLI